MNTSPVREEEIIETTFFSYHNGQSPISVNFHPRKWRPLVIFLKNEPMMAVKEAFIISGRNFGLEIKKSGIKV
jgi:hypothetical protein